MSPAGFGQQGEGRKAKILREQMGRPEGQGVIGVHVNKSELDTMRAGLVRKWAQTGNGVSS